ncbi:haloacid dehalogenase type II [Limimaricola sp. G21655-S1]|uniref:haloacid dehalogenase type II n=1 Tax=Limimaricola sp. G21655-S1 TaxID=3014768 RepID=UPI0022AFB064|nr:haloacid dehalogenase type II [Limimaricola sp. G21655-S1]MCZ4260007.1 haloacid dehalogenase type II [Limimaricola sp. G21655-S1]
MPRPDAIAFDAVETLFSLESLRPRIEAAGLPGHALETWFAQMLRDAFALCALDIYKPFRELAEATLDAMMKAQGIEERGPRIEAILSGFTELDAEPDVLPAMQRLKRDGLPVAILTNGSEKVTRALVERNGLSDFVDRVISVDEPGRWKPATRVYHHAAARIGVAPERLALVAAHGWDVQGARSAGLITGYVTRNGRPRSAVMAPADAEGETLMQVVDRLIGAR